METTYYTCRNQHCPKYKNIFLEGDATHAHCKRDRLRFADERAVPMWLWLALPVGVAAVAAAVLTWRMRAQRSGGATRGSEPLARESERHSVPPPIGPRA